jgi:hypothetical protein
MIDNPQMIKHTEMSKLEGSFKLKLHDFEFGGIELKWNRDQFMKIHDCPVARAITRSVGEVPYVGTLGFDIINSAGWVDGYEYEYTLDIDRLTEFFNILKSEKRDFITINYSPITY